MYIVQEKYPYSQGLFAWESFERTRFRAAKKLLVHLTVCIWISNLLVEMKAYEGHILHNKYVSIHSNSNHTTQEYFWWIWWAYMSIFILFTHYNLFKIRFCRCSLYLFVLKSCPIGSFLKIFSKRCVDTFQKFFKARSRQIR